MQPVLIMDKRSPEIVALRKDIEHEVGCPIRTPYDFEFLAGVVWERLHENISPTTLKRLWGYIDGAEMPRYATLSILCRVLGYRSWDEYLEALAARHGVESEVFAGEGIRVEELQPGDRIEVAWQPNRRAVLQYEGNQRFSIIEAENGKLQAGDTCSAVCFLVNRPMYLDHLVQGNQPPKTYVAGKRHGMSYVRRV